ncbi:MAG TPA: substrate-binding domain-containing protein [Chthoniobacterales bacterium]|nr:substrate-binding domain-containing protein [Chthoniobacterales bacterium]
MSLPCLSLAFFFSLGLTVSGLAQVDCCAGRQEPPAASTKRVLRVSSDPNNLPFSNERREGFENKIAELIARELDANLQYSWRAQRRGFFREALKENRADLVLGVPAHFEMALTTQPYYRSSYVFVYRKDRKLDIHSLDDPALRNLKIGVQMIGNDGRNTPPAHALADRGIIDNVVGYTVYGDYAQENPPARAIDAVAQGDVDLAIAWGPLAGYFASVAKVPLEVVPVSPAADPEIPFTFNISIGVRKGDQHLRDEIDAVLVRKHREIEAILDDYKIPRVPEPAKDVASAK